MVTGYVIFFVFLGVMIGLQRFLIPSLVGITPMAPEVARPPEVAEAIAREYNEIFRNLILIQGFFAGLTVGKLAHGEMIAGVKHSLLLMFVGLAVFSIAAI
jgi:flagellar protein FlaJ